VESAVSPENATTSQQLAELESIRAWRTEQLHRAGYREAGLVLLADDPDVDLHTAIRLLERGCQVETALRILL
jgi:hypothetical protein